MLQQYYASTNRPGYKRRKLSLNNSLLPRRSELFKSASVWKRDRFAARSAFYSSVLVVVVPLLMAFTGWCLHFLSRQFCPWHSTRFVLGIPHTSSLQEMVLTQYDQFVPTRNFWLLCGKVSGPVKVCFSHFPLTSVEKWWLSLGILLSGSQIFGSVDGLAVLPCVVDIPAALLAFVRWWDLLTGLG